VGVEKVCSVSALNYFKTTVNEHGGLNCGYRYEYMKFT